MAHNSTDYICTRTLRGKPDQNTDSWLKRTSSKKSTYKEKNRKENMLSATCSKLLYSDWPWQYYLLTFPPANRTAWTPQVTVPSRDTKCLILKTWRRKKTKKKKKEEERLFENLIWIWTLDLMLDKPSSSGRERQWHCSRPNTPL